MSNDKIIGYHYTNPRAYSSMEDGYSYGKKGLIPVRRLMNLGRGSYNLPEEAHDGIIEALLEPEPESWLHNPEFPGLWWYLMHDLRKESELVLLSFEIKPKDDAYVVERAHMENELYREGKNRGKSTRRTMNLACKKYWESRIPVFEYEDNYKLPQLAIWSTIEFDRLNVEWIKPKNEVWNGIDDG